MTDQHQRRKDEHRIHLAIAQRLRFRRAEIGITEHDAATLAKITVNQYRRHETGDAPIPHGRLCLLARSLHVSVGWFFDGL